MAHSQTTLPNSQSAFPPGPRNRFPLGNLARLDHTIYFVDRRTALATLAQKWRFEKGADVDPMALITLRPKQPMRMRAVART